MCSTSSRTGKAPPCCAPCCAPPCCAPPMCCSPGISYCIFDLESAIFDTRHVYRKALNDIAFSYYTDIPTHLLVRGKPMTTAELADLIARKCDLPVSAEDFLTEVNERASELIANPPMMSGVEHLVTHLRNCCIELGLVTSSTKANYYAKIQGREEFFENFSTVVCADDWELRAPKPEPDVYLIAMSRLGDAPGDAGPKCTLVFDGTPKGVQAARDARLPVIMPAERELPCCWSELASLRLNYLDEFNPEDFHLPQYPDEDPPWQRHRHMAHGGHHHTHHTHHAQHTHHTRQSTFTVVRRTTYSPVRRTTYSPVRRNTLTGVRRSTFSAYRRRRTIMPTTEYMTFSPPEEVEEEEEPPPPPPPPVAVVPSILNIRD